MTDCLFVTRACQKGIQSGDPTGTLEIDNVPMSCPAWSTLDLTSLWLGPAQRGEDRILPGVSGVVPYRRRATVRTVTLEMVIVGEVDHTGAVNADPWDGLRHNIWYLRTNVTDPTNIGDGTRNAVVTMPDGVTTRQADVHVGELVLGEHDNYARYLATLELSIPAGVFTP